MRNRHAKGLILSFATWAGWLVWKMERKACVRYRDQAHVRGEKAGYAGRNPRFRMGLRGAEPAIQDGLRGAEPAIQDKAS